jgi:hypothetical protein
MSTVGISSRRMRSSAEEMKEYELEKQSRWRELRIRSRGRKQEKVRMESEEEFQDWRTSMSKSLG